MPISKQAVIEASTELARSAAAADEIFAMSGRLQIPRPDLEFPRAGWLDRYKHYCEEAATLGVEVGWSQAPTAVGIPDLEGELKALYAETDGLGLGFVDILSLEEMEVATDWIRGQDWAAVVARDLQRYRATFLPLARDGADNYYVYLPDPEAPHRVIYLCHDPPGWEHRFSTLATFLDAQLARAYAQGLHRIAELEAGDYLDDAPWLAAARTLERQIDPMLLRTRDD